MGAMTLTRHVGDLHRVGVVHKGVEHGGHDEGVLQVVMLFEDAAAALHITAGAVPDVPLVEGDIK